MVDTITELPTLLKLNWNCIWIEIIAQNWIENGKLNGNGNGNWNVVFFKCNWIGIKLNWIIFGTNWTELELNRNTLSASWIELELNWNQLSALSAVNSTRPNARGELILRRAPWFQKPPARLAGKNLEYCYFNIYLKISRELSLNGLSPSVQQVYFSRILGLDDINFIS